jgi:hypothetical protein
MNPENLYKELIISDIQMKLMFTSVIPQLFAPIPSLRINKLWNICRRNDSWYAAVYRPLAVGKYRMETAEYGLMRPTTVFYLGDETASSVQRLNSPIFCHFDIAVCGTSCLILLCLWYILLCHCMHFVLHLLAPLHFATLSKIRYNAAGM